MNVPYVNYLLQSLSEVGSYLYPDGTCIIYQHYDVKITENILSWEFLWLCRLFLDKKLSIHFGEYKTEFMLHSKMKCLKEIDISSASYSIKQDDLVQYLGCQLQSKLSGKAMTSKVLKKGNAKLKFLYQ